MRTGNGIMMAAAAMVALSASSAMGSASPPLSAFLPRHSHRSGQRSVLNAIKQPGTGPGAQTARIDAMRQEAWRRATYSHLPAGFTTRQQRRAFDRQNVRPATRTMGQRPPEAVFFEKEPLRHKHPWTPLGLVVRLKGRARTEHLRLRKARTTIAGAKIVAVRVPEFG